MGLRMERLLYELHSVRRTSCSVFSNVSLQVMIVAGSAENFQINSEIKISLMMQ